MKVSNSANVKLVELWVCVLERHEGCQQKLLLFVLQFAILFILSIAIFSLLTSSYILSSVVVKISLTLYMHLHHADASHRLEEGEEIQGLSDRVNSLHDSSVDIDLTEPQSGQ